MKKNEQEKFIKKFRCKKCSTVLGGTLTGGRIGHLAKAQYYTNYMAEDPEAVFVCKECGEKYIIKLIELREQEKKYLTK